MEDLPVCHFVAYIDTTLQFASTLHQSFGHVTRIWFAANSTTLMGRAKGSNALGTLGSVTKNLIPPQNDKFWQGARLQDFIPPCHFLSHPKYYSFSCLTHMHAQNKPCTCVQKHFIDLAKAPMVRAQRNGGDNFG